MLSLTPIFNHTKVGTSKYCELAQIKVFSIHIEMERTVYSAVAKSEAQEGQSPKY